MDREKHTIKQELAILISDKADFKVSKVKKEDYIIIKGSVLQEDTTIFNVYISINSTSDKANADSTEGKID